MVASRKDTFSEATWLSDWFQPGSQSQGKCLTREVKLSNNFGIPLD